VDQWEENNNYSHQLQRENRDASKFWESAHTISQNKYMYIYIAVRKLQVNGERVRNMRNGGLNYRHCKWRIPWCSIGTNNALLSKCHTPSKYARHDVSFKSIKERSLPCADIPDTHMFSSTTCGFMVQNFAQIGQRMWKVRTKINRRPWVKYGWQRADLLLNSSPPSDSPYTSPVKKIIIIKKNKVISLQARCGPEGG